MTNCFLPIPKVHLVIPKSIPPMGPNRKKDDYQPKDCDLRQARFQLLDDPCCLHHPPLIVLLFWAISMDEMAFWIFFALDESGWVSALL